MSSDTSFLSSLKFKMNPIKIQYQHLLASFAINEQIIEQYWQELSDLYHESHRFYHNLSHIQAMIDKFLTIQTLIDDSSAVLFAIFYHDSIYHIPKQTETNEKLSADYFYQKFKHLLAPSLLDKVYTFILATEHHQLLIENNDLAYFLDLDLSILAEPSNIYQSYYQNIQKEYAHINAVVYKIGRAKILGQFLAKKRIFYSDFFYENSEKIARANLKNELKDLIL